MLRELTAAVGDPQVGPTVIGTDNRANLLVGSSPAASSKARHMIRMYLQLQEATAGGVVRLTFVPDKANPADYLTKWLSGTKFEQSVAYATNARNR